MTSIEPSLAGPISRAGWPERLFHSFLEAAPDAVVIINGGGIIVQVNSRAQRLFGYPRVELLGRSVEALMPERFRGLHVAHRQVYSDDMHTRPMGRGLDLFGLRKDGREFPIDISLSPLPNDTGVHVASAIHDMTDYRRMERRTARAHTGTGGGRPAEGQPPLSGRARASQSLEQLSSVPHLLHSSGVDAAVQQRISGVIERQTAYMARLVEDLLDMSRVRRGELTLRRESVDLSTVVPVAVEFSHLLMQARKHHLAVIPSAEPLWVSGDHSVDAGPIARTVTAAFCLRCKGDIG